MNRHRPFSLLTKILHQRVKREWKSVKREKERGTEKNLKQPVLIHFHLPRHFFFFYKSRKSTVHPCIFFFLFPSTKALLMRALTPRDPCWPFFFFFLQSFFSSISLSLPPSPSFFSPLFHPLSLSFFSSSVSLSLSLSLRLRRLPRGWHAVKSANTCKNGTR